MRVSAISTGVLLALLGFAAGGCGLLGGARHGALPPRADEATRRSLSGGEVAGFATTNGAHAWQGLPFAAPPLGPRRWRAPQPPAAWTGTRQALAAGSPCPQYPSPMGGLDAGPGGIAGSEDCLYLNVYAPPSAGRGGRPRPVMFWIHGGGNTVGSGSLYDGSILALEHDVVVVTTNYRLGPLGWFRHASLREPGGDAAEHSGNFGTLDLIQALGWLRENAASFGGDPGNVTIFGESAGGRNVVSLLLSPLAKGLFHRAIVQSGSTRSMSADFGEGSADLTQPAHRNSSREVLLRLLVREGRAADRASAHALLSGWEPAGLADYLRGIDPETLFETYAVEEREALMDVPQIFRDGSVLPRERFPERLAAGAHHHVPVMLGTNRDEEKIFMAIDPRFVRLAFGLPVWRHDPAFYSARGELLSRAWKAGGADAPATALALAQEPGVWVYRFDWDEMPRVLWIDPAELIGAGHGLEIPFVFGRFELGKRAEILFHDDSLAGRVQLSKQMQAYWAEFARSGDPGQGGAQALPRWEPWNPRMPRFLVFDTEAGGGLRHSDAVESVEAVVAELFTDPRISDTSQRCAVLAELVTDQYVSPQDFRNAAGGACRDSVTAAN